MVVPAAIWLVGVLLWSARRPSGGKQLPAISIIVAARNEEELIRSCLESLLGQNYPDRLIEILLVDDHSTDRTPQIAEELRTAHPGRLRVLSAPPSPPGFGSKKWALQYAIRQARGEILLFTDADCVVRPEWAATMMTHFGPGVGAVTGAIFPPLRQGLGERLFRLERLMVSLTTASAIGWGHPASAAGGNFAYRREVFEKLGGLAHPELASGDDDLMAQTIARRGWRVDFAKGADSVVTDLRPPDVRRAIAAAARHQSTLRYYPLRWRALFALSIVSGAAVLGCIVAAFLQVSLVFPLIAGLLLRAGLDLAGVNRFCHSLRQTVSPADFALAEVLLPFYLVARPLFLLSPRFAWKGRVHSSAVPLPGETRT
ncbi:glycosyltransferase [bacterium]|nr:glycosyltransferase [bacterium]MBU1983751.1 glycosyltransferase [bacterium]